MVSSNKLGLVLLMGLLFSYPFGIIALVFWLLIRNDKKKHNIALPIVLSLGLLSSLTALTYMLIAY